MSSRARPLEYSCELSPLLKLMSHAMNAHVRCASVQDIASAESALQLVFYMCLEHVQAARTDDL